MEEVWKIFKMNITFIFIASNFLCIDETLYAARVRCAFSQYMKNKPEKYGIKYWCLVDAYYRYLLAVEIYLGKNSPDEKKETQVGMKAVLNLMEPYFKTNRSLTVDNFFSSVILAEKLWSVKITLVGTVNVNKILYQSAF